MDNNLLEALIALHKDAYAELTSTAISYEEDNLRNCFTQRKFNEDIHNFMEQSASIHKRIMKRLKYINFDNCWSKHMSTKVPQKRFPLTKKKLNKYKSARRSIYGGDHIKDFLDEAELYDDLEKVLTWLGENGIISYEKYEVADD